MSLPSRAARASRRSIRRSASMATPSRTSTVTGGTGPGGSFKVGDTLTLKFQLFDNQATPAAVADLTDQRCLGRHLPRRRTDEQPPARLRSWIGRPEHEDHGHADLRCATQTYTYVPVATWPASSIAPLNNPAAGTQTNPAGNYTVWFYWARTTSGVRDAVDAQVAVAFGVNQKASGRQVVTQAACGCVPWPVSERLPAPRAARRPAEERRDLQHLPQPECLRPRGRVDRTRLHRRCPVRRQRRRVGGLPVRRVHGDGGPDAWRGRRLPAAGAQHPLRPAARGLRRTQQHRVAPDDPAEDAELPGVQQQPARLPGDPPPPGRPRLHQLPPEHQRRLLRARSPAATGRAATHRASATTSPGRLPPPGRASPVTTRRTRPRTRSSTRISAGRRRSRPAPSATARTPRTQWPRCTTSPHRIVLRTRASPSAANRSGSTIMNREMSSVASPGRARGGRGPLR